MRAFNAEVLSLLGVGLAITTLRASVRVCSVGLKRLSPDDCLVALASICYIVETALAYLAEEKVNGLSNSFMTDAERAALQPSSVEYELRELGSKIQLASWISYSVLLWSLKAAVCSLYLRLANSHRRGYRLPVYIGFGVIAASWLAITLNLFLSCRPLRLMWQVYPDPGAQCKPTSSPVLIWTYMGFNVATYVYLMAMPVPMLFKAALPPWQKIITVVLLGCGLFVTAAAVLRAVVVSSSADVQLSRLWAIREAFAALFTANMAILLPSLTQWAISWRSSPGAHPCKHTKPQSTFERWPSTNMNGNDSSESVAGALYIREKTDTDPRPSSGGESERRIQRRIDVCVMAEDERAPVKSGNYTGVWSGDKSGRPVPQTRSRYFGDHIYQRAYVRM
ncbi:hypothetical protein TOPH_06267 [Tolypocladium ophioglossoides CBS 100239]|uniref:Rhodopsin domain-containing protein n=1 Tax=Tolypocladium ophioglossoides (strain CBS 100239) TaxID=1163406 RepID=A0A0L0N4Y4_TOLOC|nr:hypothetical protein TOPH_06267 [Tolypocladium ophioglossoides CBS 100239]